MTPAAAITPDEILSRYQVVLLDAYGVLVDDRGPLPGALEFVRRLRADGKRFMILTNSASRLPERIARQFQAMGFAVDTGQILSSGQLLPGYFAHQGLHGAPSLVLGTTDSQRYVERAGGRVLSLEQAGSAEVLVLADQAGFDCLEGMNRALSLLLGRRDRGDEMHLLLCNPDLIYPVDSGAFGFTAGGLAAMLEAVLQERYGQRERGFVRLGKPHAPLFEEALRRSGDGRAVMLGDQPATDILGANRAGIDSVLLGTGLGGDRGDPGGIRPTWYLPDLT